MDETDIKNLRQAPSKGSHVKKTEMSPADIIMSKKWMMHPFTVLTFLLA